MRICKCGNEIPNTKIIDGKRRNLRNRTVCLDCLPFGESNFRQKTKEEIRSANAEKSRRHYHRRKAKLGVDPIRLLRETRKQEIIDAIGGSCQLCGYDKAVRNLAFHHISNKEFELSSRGFQYSIEKIIAEVRKCILVCHNCHGEVHDGLVEESKIEKAHSEVKRIMDVYLQNHQR